MKLDGLGELRLWSYTHRWLAANGCDGMRD